MKKYLLPLVLLASVGGLFLLKKGRKSEQKYAKKSSEKSKPSNSGKMTNAERRENYIKEYGPAFLELSKSSGVPALFLIAQSGLETGWGKSTLVTQGYNFGGIKAKDGQKYINALTWEYVRDYTAYPDRVLFDGVDGRKVLQEKHEASGKWKIRVYQRFRKFDNLSDGLADYVQRFSRPLYQGAFEYAKGDPVLFAEYIWKKGYATDPEYVGKIKSIILTVKGDVERIQKGGI